MESRIGFCGTELIKPRGPWHGSADVELGTAGRVDWFNEPAPPHRNRRPPIPRT
ncbi:hypothetical protein SUDANB146_06273 [Streptomyces sp. enrichment culture]